MRLFTISQGIVMNKSIFFLWLFMPVACALALEYVKPEVTTKTEVTITEPTPEIANPTKPKVAVVELTNGMNVKKILMKLVEIEEDPSIDGILFTIDHTGGAVSTFSVIHDTIKAVSLKKPTVGLLVGQAFSCGYLMASATDYLIAHSMSEIGSIGIFYEITRFRNAQQKDKDINAELAKEIISAGKFKMIQHPFGPELDDELRNYAQENAQCLYEHFVQTVARNRNLNLEQELLWADGKVFVAPKALQLGLIDEIGTIFTAKQKLLELIQKKNHAHANATSVELIFEKDTK